ncbi:MAG: hypothetical protein WA021_04965 [Minisyncoccia bacterium]
MLTSAAILEDLDELYIQLLANNQGVEPKVTTRGGITAITLKKGWQFVFQAADDRRTFAMQIRRPDGEAHRGICLLRYDDYATLQLLVEEAGA